VPPSCTMKVKTTKQPKSRERAWIYLCRTKQRAGIGRSSRGLRESKSFVPGEDSIDVIPCSMHSCDHFLEAAEYERNACSWRAVRIHELANTKQMCKRDIPAALRGQKGFSEAASGGASAKHMLYPDLRCGACRKLSEARWEKLYSE